MIVISRGREEEEEDLFSVVSVMRYRNVSKKEALRVDCLGWVNT